MSQLTIVAKSVNSKTLYDHILKFLEEGVYDFGVVWDSEAHRESFIYIIEDFLGEMQDDGKIEQVKVISDRRNNKYTDMEVGIYHIDVYYRQRNCLNTTEILMTIKDVGDLDEDIEAFFANNP